MLDSVIRENKTYYPQILLEEFKYEIKKNKMENLIDDDFGTGSADSESYKPDNGSDNGSDNKSEKPSKKFESD